MYLIPLILFIIIPNDYSNLSPFLVPEQQSSLSIRNTFLLIEYIKLENQLENIIKSPVYDVILLLTVLCEFIIPFILRHFYPGYKSNMMVMSALGSTDSPCHIFYNAWLIYLGCFFLLTSCLYYKKEKALYPVLSVFILLSIGAFAIGAGLISGIFRVNGSKETITMSSLIHGFASALGFVALLFFPLWKGIISFKERSIKEGTIDITAFIFALLFFICFILGDKEQFKNTIFKYEGLYERLALFFMYVPFIYDSVVSLHPLSTVFSL